jgi:hypothetical protein
LLALFFLVLILVVGAVHLYFNRQPRTKGRVAQIFLLWLLVIAVGLGSVFGFIGHTVFADTTAASILCYWMRGNVWTATAIGFSVWYLGDAVVHIRSIVVEANYAPNNAGVTLYMDILLPVILIALLVYYLHVNRAEEHERTHWEGTLGQVG